MVTGTCYVVAHPLKANVLSGHRRGWFDVRDFGAVFDREEPLPHPAGDQVQLRRRIIFAASSCSPR